MGKKESDGKYYKVYKSRDNHISTKVNKDGRNLLDESSYQILSAFSKGKLIVGGELVPIAQYIDCSE